MSKALKITLLSAMFLFIYCLLFYFLLSSQLRLDFASFYSAASAYKIGANPYFNLVASYLNPPIKLPANLNPPIFLLILSPLTYLNFKLASALWFLCSLAAGIFGALLSFKLCCSREFFQQYWPALLFIYLGMFSTLMNTGIGQIGGILLFFMMGGYYCYCHNKSFLAGVLWGFIIALKFFPALLFLFVFSQKRYYVMFIMLITCIIAFTLPLIINGYELYSLYSNMLSRVLWYGDNWNGSLYGFIFRPFIEIKHSSYLGWIKCSYLILSIILGFWYIKKIIQFRHQAPKHQDHRAFSFTLVMMVFLSPLGWLYYFSLFIMPLTLIWHSLNKAPLTANSTRILWVISLFLINFPMGYVETGAMGALLARLSIYSIYFYGVFILLYLISHLNNPSTLIEVSDLRGNKANIQPLISTLGLSLFVTCCCIIIQLSHVMRHGL